MRKNRFFWALIFSLSLTTSCTQKPVDGTVRLLLTETPKSLDPILSSDAIAAEVLGAIYESPYQYNYYKRPYAVEPNLADGMPQFSKDEKTVTIKIKSGVRFQDDPCFPGGKGRALTASDFIFAFKRLADPKQASEGFWTIDKKILGLNEWREKQKLNTKTNYDEKVEGLQAPDDQTLVIKLTQKYPQLIYILTMVYTAPMAHEAVEKYGVETVSHPVGTGPFVMKEFVRDSKIILERNPNYREVTFPADAPPEYSSEVGKKLPLADRIEAYFIVEPQPRWLKLMKAEGDLAVIPKDSFDQAIDKEGNLKSDLKDKGFVLNKSDSTTCWWLSFNMMDPILGKQPLLRKAIGLAHDSAREIELFKNGRGTAMNQILPASVKGHDPSLAPREFNVEKAKGLLAKAGFPGGKGLPPFTFDVQSASSQRQFAEFIKDEMSKIGIQINIVVNTRPQLLEKNKKGQLQIHQDGWIADYPDAENFMQLLYGPNSAPGPNSSQFKHAEFDKLYVEMASMQEGPARQKLINRMNQILLEESPWTPDYNEKIYSVNTGWLRNYKYSDFAYNWYKYLRVDTEKKKELFKKF